MGSTGDWYDKYIRNLSVQIVKNFHCIRMWYIHMCICTCTDLKCAQYLIIWPLSNPMYVLLLPHEYLGHLLCFILTFMPAFWRQSTTDYQITTLKRLRHVFQPPSSCTCTCPGVALGNLVNIVTFLNSQAESVLVAHPPSFYQLEGAGSTENEHGGTEEVCTYMYLDFRHRCV